MPKDKFDGMGGSYIVNEAGERELVERTLQPGENTPDAPVAANSSAEASAEAKADDAKSDSKSSKKGN